MQELWDQAEPRQGGALIAGESHLLEGYQKLATIDPPAMSSLVLQLTRAYDDIRDVARREPALLGRAQLYAHRLALARQALERVHAG